jgi:methyl-accepting chemotaxis protein
METGQRGFLLTGLDASLDPYINGETALQADIETLHAYEHEAAGITDSDIDNLRNGVNDWKTLAAEPEIEARIAIRDYPETMHDVEAMMNSGEGKQRMDAIRVELGGFMDSEVALNEQRAQDVAAKSSSTRTLGIAIAGIAIAVMMVIGFLLSRSISGGIGRVAGALRQIAVGDLTQKVESKSSDEIGDMTRSYGEMQEYLQGMAVAADNLAQGNLAVAVAPKSENDALGNAFSQMISSLRDLIGQVRDNSTNLASSSQQMNRAAEEAGKATSEIASSSQQVAKGADDQSRSIQDVTTSMGQLNQASQQVAKGAQEQANLVQQATDVVNQVSTAITQVSESAQSATQGAQEAGTLSEQGAQQAQRTIEGINRVKESSQQVAGQIEEMNSLSAEIGKVVAVIDDIASQTNLLALNATIEAARAGEHGKGFAVVAEEVRQLAERVAVSTKEIESTIEKMQKAADESVSAVNSSTEDVDNGIKLAEEAGNALAEILGKSQDVGQQVEQISAAAEQVNASATEMVNAIEGISKVVEQNTAGAEEMTATGTEVSKAVEGVAGVSEENSAASQQVSASAQEMSAQVEEVVASAQSLNEMADNLNNLVAAFKLDEDKKQVVATSKPENSDGQDA